jgi:hypothetical protein
MPRRGKGKSGRKSRLSKEVAGVEVKVQEEDDRTHGQPKVQATALTTVTATDPHAESLAADDFRIACLNPNVSDPLRWMTAFTVKGEQHDLSAWQVVHTDIHARMHTYTHTNKYIHAHTDIHISIHAYVHIRTYIRYFSPYMYTHAHIYTIQYMCGELPPSRDSRMSWRPHRYRRNTRMTSCI